MSADSSTSIWRRLAILTGLSAVAVVAPVLDLYGKNPEVFVANRTGTYEIFSFGIGVALIVPLISWGVLAIARAIGGRAPDVAFGVLAGVLSVATGLVVSRQVLPDNTVLAILLTLAVAAVVFWLVRSTEVIFVVAAVAIPVLAVMFLATSATARLIWSEPAPVEAATRVGDPHNIVMLQLDEFPLASILNTDGTINETLFPNFARLADKGTWYRNALSESIATTQSVPAILSGVYGEDGQSPSYVDHPDNLFTLLGGSYEMHVIEWVAEMCPEEICPEYAGRAPARFSNLLKDVGVVYGHLTLPGSLRGDLPSIDNSWKGFLGQADTPEGTGVEIDGLPLEPPSQRADWINWVQRLINGIDAGTPPTLSYAHLRAPHVPWILNPSGTQYERPEEYTEVLGVEGDGRWEKDPNAALLGFQRHLYQVGFLDKMIGRLLDQLEETGTWDDTMVIVVADHGASFVPGEHRRWPYENNRDDLYRVPLFIKYPGQSEGKTVDLPAFGVDILPTVVDALDIDTDWSFDGVSLVDLDVDRPHTPQRWCCNGEGVSTDLGILFDQAKRNHEWIPDQSTWDGIAGVGPATSLIGASVSDLNVVASDGFKWSFELGDSLADVDRSTGLVQTVVTGRIAAPSAPGGDELLVVLNGVVAGVAHLSRDTATGGTFAGLVAEDLVHDGDNNAALLLSDGEGAWIAGTVDDVRLNLVADDGHQIEFGAEGSRRIQVDRVDATSDGWKVTGWAADVTGKLTADTIYVFAGDHLLYSGPPNTENANVVRWFNSEDLLKSGFEITVDAADVPEGVTQLLVVAEFGDHAVGDPAILPTGD